MPKIQIPQSQIRAPGPVQQPRMSAEAAGGAQAAAAREMGRAIAGVSQDIAKVMEDRDRFEANLQYLENRNVAMQEFANLKQNAKEDAEGFIEEVQSHFDRSIPEALDKAPSSTAARQWLEERYTGLRLEVMQQASEFTAAARTATTLRRSGEAVDRMAVEARAFPENRDRIREQLDTFVNDAPYLSEAHRAELRRKATEAINNGSLDGWVAGFEFGKDIKVSDAERALVDLRGNKHQYKELVTPAMYDAAETRLQRLAKSLSDRDRVSLDADIRDALVAIRNHGTYEGPVTEARIRMAYKEDPERIQRTLITLDAERAAYNARMRLGVTTPEEDAQTLQQFRETTKGFGAADIDPRVSAVAREVMEKRKALDTDPVAYILATDPTIAEHLRTAIEMNDPRDYEVALSRLDDRQATLGVPPYRRQYLGKGAADAFVENIQGMKAEQVANELENLRGRYHSRWGVVLHELGQAKLPSGYIALGRLDTAADASTRKQLAAALDVGEETLRKNAGSEAASDVAKEIDGYLTEFAATMAPAGEMGMRIVGQERNAMYLLALSDVSRAGSAKAAAERAYKALLGDRYDFEDTYRVPRGMAHVARASIYESTVARQISDFTPTAVGTQDPTLWGTELGIQERQSLAYRNAVENGIWVNNEDGSGLLRMAPDVANGYTYSPVVLQDGKRWEIKFEDMQDRAYETWLSTQGAP